MSDKSRKTNGKTKNDSEKISSAKKLFKREIFFGSVMAAPPSEDKRIEIFFRALEEKMSLDDTKKELAEKGLRGLYPRNPTEFILECCLRRNDALEDDRKKYDYKKFVSLVNRIYKNSEVKEPVVICREKKGKNNIITFGALHDFVKKMSDEPTETEKKRTAQITQNFRKDLKNFDYAGEDFEERLQVLFEEHKDNLSIASDSARFYFAKYIYNIICHQIFELKNVMLTFMKKNIKNTDDLLEEIDFYGSSSAWSIKYYFVFDEIIDEFHAKRRYIKKVQPKPEDQEKQNPQDSASKKTGNNRSKQGIGMVPSDVKKILLANLLNVFILSGKPSYERIKNEQYLKLLDPYEQLSNLTNKTWLFDNNIKPWQHEEAVRIVKDIKLSDFYGYGIDFTQLYRILFEIALSKEAVAPNEKTIDADLTEKEKTDLIKKENDRKKEFIIKILDGIYDMSRSAVMLFLISAKGALFDIKQCIEKHGEEFDEKDALDLDRVNYILRRIGYPAINECGVTVQEIDVENEYERVFSGSAAQVDDFVEFMASCYEETNFIPVPFVVENVSAKKRENAIKHRKPSPEVKKDAPRSHR